MKTIMLIDSSGAQYFRRHRAAWKLINKPNDKDTLWVIADIPEETLETLDMPVLFGRDRSQLIGRHLSASFPHSQFRAAFVVSGGVLKPGTALLTGLSTADAITRELAKINNPVAGVWGVFMLLTLTARHLGIKDALLVLPNPHYLRILVTKNFIPVVTRCIHRNSEESEQGSDANEIERTRQHLESHKIFEHEAIPPVYYLGKLSFSPLPDAFTPKGDAAYLHPLFERLASSPSGQLAPLQFRTRHLTDRIRRTAYLATAACLLTAILFGQKEMHGLIKLDEQEHTLKTDLQRAAAENKRFSIYARANKTDPAMVRQATKFAALEIDAAPTPESILRYVASLIADLPEVRIKNLTYQFPKPGQQLCNEQSPAASTDAPLHYTELQFSILLTGDPTHAEQIEIGRRLSSAIKANSSVRLIQDPANLSSLNTIRSGFGMEKTDAEWCMSIPWNVTPHQDAP